jgi:S1-C subfamily serine protease
MIGVELASDRWVRRYQIEGLPVVHVYPGLPAARAGMLGAYRGPRGEVVLGDVIIEVEDQPIASNDDFYDALERHSPGDTITVRSRLGDKTRTYEVELIESQ